MSKKFFVVAFQQRHSHIIARGYLFFIVFLNIFLLRCSVPFELVFLPTRTQQNMHYITNIRLPSLSFFFNRLDYIIVIMLIKKLFNRILYSFEFLYTYDYISLFLIAFSVTISLISVNLYYIYFLINMNIVILLVIITK